MPNPGRADGRQEGHAGKATPHLPTTSHTWLIKAASSCACATTHACQQRCHVSRLASLLHAWQAVFTFAFFATTLKVWSAGKVFNALSSSPELRSLF